MILFAFFFKFMNSFYCYTVHDFDQFDSLCWNVSCTLIGCFSSDVDCLYTSNPRLDPQAKPIYSVPDIETLAVMKIIYAETRKQTVTDSHILLTFEVDDLPATVAADWNLISP